MFYEEQLTRLFAPVSQAPGTYDYILLWRLPEHWGRAPRMGEPYGRCYLRLQRGDGQREAGQTCVFFSVVQEEAPPLLPYLNRLVERVAGLFFLDVFKTRWVLHVPAGLEGRAVDAFAEMACDWFASGRGPAIRALYPREEPPVPAELVEVEGLYESDKELVWITDESAGGVCGARVHAAPRPTVILTQRLGSDIYYNRERIALWLREAFALSPPETTWIEHIAPSTFNGGQEIFRELWLNGAPPRGLPLEEGRALLTQSRSFQLPLGPINPDGHPLIVAHLDHRQGIRPGAGRAYAGDAKRGERYVFVHEDGRCRRLQNRFKRLYGERFRWGDDSDAAHGLAYSILADLAGEAAAKEYWQPFHEEVLAALPTAEDLTLGEAQIRAWLEEARPPAGGDGAH